MPAVSHVLVVGAGLAGTATATGLAAAGVAVDLIDVKPEITAIGSGITMQGNGLRELRRLGVSRRTAFVAVMSPRGPWRVSTSEALHLGFSKARFRGLGLTSMESAGRT